MEKSIVHRIYLTNLVFYLNKSPKMLVGQKKQRAAPAASDERSMSEQKRAYLSEVEKGKRNVSLDVVEKLAKALDVSPDVLMVSLSQ